MPIYAKIFCKTAFFGNNYVRRCILWVPQSRIYDTLQVWGVSLPQVGNIFDVTNPGLTTIAYLRHAARSTRPTDASVATSSTATSTARSTRHNAGERQRCHPLPPWRAERAVPRRGTIVVSPTQLVPEVLAVWGSDFKRRDSVS